MITAPGIYPDVDETTYHADTDLAPELGRSLSSTGAKTLVTKTPAHFHWERDQGRPDTHAFDIGHAAHRFILGAGNDIVRVHADSWRAKVNQDKAKIARTLGLVPLLADDYRAALNMAKAVKRHPIGRNILAAGRPEVSLYWTDPATGVTCRARIDWLRDNAIVDVKTAATANPDEFGTAAVKFGYALQAAWYQRGAYALGLGRLPFLHLIVEKEPPHRVSVVQLDDEAIAVGEELADRALATYAECESTGVWPGYPTDIATVSLPAWYVRANQGALII